MRSQSLSQESSRGIRKFDLLRAFGNAVPDFGDQLDTFRNGQFERICGSEFHESKLAHGACVCQALMRYGVSAKCTSCPVAHEDASNTSGPGTPLTFPFYQLPISTPRCFKPSALDARVGRHVELGNKCAEQFDLVFRAE